MEPNENPNLPVNNSTTSDRLEPTEQTDNTDTKVFSHKKVITPLNSNIHPEEHATPTEVTPVINNVIAPIPTPTEFTQTAEIQPTLSAGTSQEEIAQKPVSSKRKEILEALFVLVLATIAGAIFHLWYRLTIKILPNSVSFCSNSSNDGISFACHGTLLGNFAAYITLFSLVSYICYLVIKKSNVLPFYYGGFFVGILFFIETALVLNLAAAYKLRWLFDHGSVWANWLLPGLVSGVITIIFYLIIKYTQPLVKTVLGFLLTGFILLTLIFMPGLVNNFIGQQNKAGIQESENKTIENIKNSDIKIYAPKNYNGPLKLSSAQSLIGLADLIPRYELFYDFPNPIPNQPDNTIVHIYKGSTNGFNPPTNCGDGSPSSEKYKSELEYPCKVVLTTKRGREVYGYRSPFKLQYYNIDPSSDDIKKIQPANFYIPIGDDVISFSDPSSAEDTNESPFTPSVIEEFVDSLEPLSGYELEQFTDQYILY